jgi:hypothetical protein
MNSQLDAHIYVVARFARLGAPPIAMEMELGNLLASIALPDGERAALKQRLLELLAAYGRERDPLVEKAEQLVKKVLPNEYLKLGNDPCYLAQRAAREGWAVKESAKLQEILTIAAQCDALDEMLKEQLRLLFGVER